jgi:hypothetical protein
MKRFLVLVVLKLSIVLIVFVSCTNPGLEKSTGESRTVPKATSEQAVPFLSGRVVESMDSGNYTYVNIEKDGNNTWVAVPRMKITAGQDITFKPGAVMKNFESKTQNRVFETIIFSGGPSGANMGTAVKSSKPKAKVPETGAIKVDKATGPDAYTVAELYEKGTELDNKAVFVRGQVVKFSANIMNKNWIHIQDGSGNPSMGTNDIIVTSLENTSVGDIVTVNGTLFKDKDFGSGYKFPVIIEQANINK